MKYFGRKNQQYLDSLIDLIPADNCALVVDACMGSGAFTKGISVGMTGNGTKAMAFELDRSMYTLHIMAVQHPYELIDAIKQKSYSKATYIASKNRIDNVLSHRSTDITLKEQLQTAVAAYCSLYLSFNAMRASYRSLTTYKKETDPIKKEAKKQAQLKTSFNFHEGIAEEILNEAESLANVDIRNESFMDAPELFECPDNLIYLDVPYPLDQRDSSESNENTDARKTTKKNRQDKLAADGKAGYLKDWTNKDHDKFLNLVHKAVATGHPAKMIICANFTVDEDGNLKNLAGNTYNKYLLPLGFRLVVVTNTTASVSSKNNAKVPKVEVVWINYKNIVGSWDDLTYFDYKDVYG